MRAASAQDKALCCWAGVLHKCFLALVQDGEAPVMLCDLVESALPGGLTHEQTAGRPSLRLVFPQLLESRPPALPLA